MSCIDTLELYKVADSEGIIIEDWEFTPPLEAIYWKGPDLPPVIGLSNKLFTDSSYYRCVLAEELGHYFTTAGSYLTYKHMNYRERLNVSRTEYKAIKWAAEFLMPTQLLKKAIVWECYWTHHCLAEYFDVTVEMAKFRLNLPDVGELVRYTKGMKYG